MTKWATLPEKLKDYGYWCVWRFETRQEGLTKVPYNPMTARRASSNNASTFAPFQTALAALEKGKYDGLGIGVFGDLAAVDIDHCIENGKLSDTAQEIISTMGSYTEYSPSGAGIRIIFKAPGFMHDRRRYYIKHPNNGVEVYIAGSTNRFVTITGNALNDLPIQTRNDEISAVLEKYMQRPARRLEEPMAGGAALLTDDEVLRKAERSAQGPKFMRLFRGDLAGFTSHSEADMSFCDMLAFWCCRNVEQMDRIFRKSGLMREKWDEPRSGSTYGGITIQVAIEDRDTVYNPEEYRKQRLLKLFDADEVPSVRPYDFTDTGNAQVFARVFGRRAIYVKSIGWLIWNGKVWVDNELDARELAILLTDQMLHDAHNEIRAASEAAAAADVAEDAPAKESAKTQKAQAEAYRNHAKRSRQASRITGLLTLAQALMQVNGEELDAHPYLLNTPAGVVDLKDSSIQPHDPKLYCTKITTCSPGDAGREMFERFIDTITQGDMELAAFLQAVAGMSVIGKVFEENLIMALGDGKNGKSVNYNAQAAVLGTYAGTIAAEVLTTANKSKGAEMATLKGKRLIIAAETEEGARLSASMVKQLTSTDKIHAERKYKDPEDFTPTHSIVLYTNHLPRVGSTDSGIWRRLVVIPFNAKISGEKEVKNYADVLIAEAGPALLSWIIEGARLFIENGHKLPRSDAVQNAIDQYRQDSDWLAHFLEECCETGPGKRCGAGDLYDTYRYWAERTGEFKRRKDDFKNEMEKRGFRGHKTEKGVVWLGLEVPSLAGFYPNEDVMKT